MKRVDCGVFLPMLAGRLTCFLDPENSMENVPEPYGQRYDVSLILFGYMGQDKGFFIMAAWLPGRQD